MSMAPKYAVFAKTVPSRSRMVSSIKLPEVGMGRLSAARLESAQVIADSGTTPQPQFPSKAPEAGMELKSARRGQRRQANRREGMARRESALAGELRLSKTDGETAKLVPQSESMPVWLTWLIRWQRRSSVVTFFLVSATLAVYGGTVYTQQLWNREYRQLETLQLQQRQLTAASEVLKNQLADQAEQQDTGLVPATPNNNLFLQPAQEQPKSTPSSTRAIDPAAKQQLAPTPVGY
ncbi:hypothetical protein [Microseira wollei]|uniref:Cell division protein FtsL n=1 Tax=Microseira wollei NIES-4236 TaxID=2530354 RepID=A0AAV3XE74_9CYAN|nr:hypothetical protein [Microseira wollei]GET40838.1 hypothetical protein MiSe_56500 [Microseira wollei NIES-4236]